VEQNQENLTNQVSKKEEGLQHQVSISKTNVSKKLLILAGFIASFIVGGISGYLLGLNAKTLGLIKKTGSTVQPTIQPQLIEPTKTAENIHHALLTLLSLTDRENLEISRTYSIRWEDEDLEYWGDEIIICLIGFSPEEEEISAKEEWNEQLCTYRSGDLSGSYLIAKTKLTNGSYEWYVPDDLYQRFESKPIKFKIRLLVFDNLPPEGRTEWAGNVGWDESRDYLFIRDE